MSRRYRYDRRPIRYQQWPYELIVAAFVIGLAGYGLYRAGVWVWRLF